MMQFPILITIQFLHVPLYLQMKSIVQNIHINRLTFSKMFFEREYWLNYRFPIIRKEKIKKNIKRIKMIFQCDCT